MMPCLVLGWRRRLSKLLMPTAMGRLELGQSRRRTWRGRVRRGTDLARAASLRGAELADARMRAWMMHRPPRTPTARWTPALLGDGDWVEILRLPRPLKVNLGK